MRASGKTRVSPLHREAAAGHDQRTSPAAAFVEDRRPEAIAQRELVEVIQNKTGLPDHLKSGIESLSGMSMDGVKVHYNSSRPAQLAASAYAQGTDIHVAPGQEKHLPHEAWHLVQQAQGRVSATMRTRDGVPVNDDPGLEREADAMGARAAAASAAARGADSVAGRAGHQPTAADAPVQRTLVKFDANLYSDDEIEALKASYSKQSGEIDKHQGDHSLYIVQENMNGTVTFHPYVPISGGPAPSRLKRHPFDKETQNNVKLGTKGFHRRHIIPNHLMKLAIDAWQKAHPTAMTLKKAQELLDKLNNYAPNLIPGPGAENSAIGMFTNSASGKLEKAATMQGTMPAPQFSAILAVNLGQFDGFQQAKQSELIDPVLSVFGSDEMQIEPKSALAFGADLQVSTDFDWPGGTQAEYEAWKFVYERFRSVQAKPGDWSSEHFDMLISEFKSLPKPTG